MRAWDVRASKSKLRAILHSPLMHDMWMWNEINAVIIFGESF